MADERRPGLGEGIRTGIGILSAFKEAIEETIEEALERGDLSPERARSVIREGALRVQSSIDEARDRLDLVQRRELDAVIAEMAELRRRLEALEGAASRAGATAPPILPVEAGSVAADPRSTPPSGGAGATPGGGAGGEHGFPID